MPENDKRLNNFLKRKLFFQSGAPGHVERGFDNRVKNSSSKSREFFSQCPKLVFKKISEKIISPQNVPMVTVIAVLTTGPRNLCQKAKKFLLNARKW